MTDTREMFRALEFAHYAERFRGKTFVIAMPVGVSFAELLMDFKVFAGYHIGLALVTADPEFALEKAISKANQRGARFELSIVTDLIYRRETGELTLDFDRIRQSLSQGKTPVIAYCGGPGEEPPGTEAGLEPVYGLAAAVSERLNPRKLFLVHALAGALKQILPRVSAQKSELEELSQRLEEAHRTEGAALFTFIRECLESGIPDVVLIEGLSGELFGEVFTHDGAGVLINATTRSGIRPASIKDITDIALLLRPEIEAGRILPRDENAIEANIDKYWIYEIDGMGVGLACLKDFGEVAELSQFSTLPRYRGKGRAKDLARFLTDQARERGYSSVFALSIDDRMWEFFVSLGFERVARESLPEAWKKHYDMRRKSRAFRLDLSRSAAKPAEFLEK